MRWFGHVERKMMTGSNDVLYTPEKDLVGLC